LLCDGTVVSSSEYPDLFQTIGYAWGKGRGVGDFRLPDLRGRFLRGVDSEAESVPRDPGRDIREAAYPGGNSGNDVGSVQEDSFKQHSHGLWGSPWAIGNGVDGTPQLIKFHAAKSPDDSAPEGVNPNAILSEGGLETRPKNCYVNWMIKARPD
jgi:microcystin-dependent protein